MREVIMQICRDTVALIALVVFFVAMLIIAMASGAKDHDWPDED